MNVATQQGSGVVRSDRSNGLAGAVAHATLSYLRNNSYQCAAGLRVHDRDATIEIAARIGPIVADEWQIWQFLEFVVNLLPP